MKIICDIKDFKTVCEKFNAEVMCEYGSSNLHFYSKDGDIIEYHLPRCNEVKDPRYVKPFHATHESINYKI